MITASTLPGGDLTQDLAACRGLDLARLIVVDRIADTTIDTSGTSGPTRRRGYTRLRRNLGDPAVPVHGVVTASRTSITTLDRLYRDQLTWYSAHRTGPWLARTETNL